MVKWVGVALNFLKCSYHKHNNWEIVLQINGYGKIIIEDKCYELYPGVIFCIPPYTLHAKYSDSCFTDVFLHIDELCFSDIKGNYQVYTFKDDEEKTIETLLMICLRVFHKKNRNYLIIINAICESILKILISWHNGSKKNEPVDIIKTTLKKNFTNPEFKISDSMDSLPYSKDYLRRQFKGDTGVTPIEYLLNLRIEYAKNLLSSKKKLKMPISEISYYSGFYDASYFTKIFKMKTGKTPKSFAREVASNTMVQTYTNDDNL